MRRTLNRSAGTEKVPVAVGTTPPRWTDALTGAPITVARAALLGGAAPGRCRGQLVACMRRQLRTSWPAPINQDARCTAQRKRGTLLCHLGDRVRRMRVTDGFPERGFAQH
eukprot:802233-Prymnesium_polylepis.1